MLAKIVFWRAIFVSEQAAEGVGGLAARGRKARSRIPERRERAFRAYLELLDTAAWFRYQVEAGLSQMELNLERFRVLEVLRSGGPMTMAALAERRFCRRQSVAVTVRALVEKGWLQIETIRMPATEVPETHLSKAQRGQERLGRAAALVRLTEQGESFIDGATRRHAKVVYAFMRALALRDVDRLGETCRKIREGDPFRLIQELTMEDVD
jgi:DNA-binding MarR family transcriptional regulator